MSLFNDEVTKFTRNIILERLSKWLRETKGIDVSVDEMSAALNMTIQMTPKVLSNTTVNTHALTGTTANVSKTTTKSTKTNYNVDYNTPCQYVPVRGENKRPCGKPSYVGTNFCPKCWGLTTVIRQYGPPPPELVKAKQVKQPVQQVPYQFQPQQNQQFQPQQFQPQPQQMQQFQPAQTFKPINFQGFQPQQFQPQPINIPFPDKPQQSKNEVVLTQYGDNKLLDKETGLIGIKNDNENIVAQAILKNGIESPLSEQDKQLALSRGFQIRVEKSPPPVKEELNPPSTEKTEVPKVETPKEEPPKPTTTSNPFATFGAQMPSNPLNPQVNMPFTMNPLIKPQPPTDTQQA